MRRLMSSERAHEFLHVCLEVDPTGEIGHEPLDRSVRQVRQRHARREADVAAVLVPRE